MNETERHYGVEVTPYVHETGGWALKAGGYSPVVCEAWVRVDVADYVVYDGPITRFDPDYNYVKAMAEGMTQEFQERLREDLRGKGRSYLVALELLKAVSDIERTDKVPPTLKRRIEGFLLV